MSNLRIEFLGSYLWVSVLLCLAFLSVIFLYYRRTTPPLTGSIRWLLIVIRAVAIVALFMALSQPIFTYSTIKEQKKRLAILLDRSNSMNLPNSSDSDATRREIAQTIFDSWILSDLHEQVDVEVYSFAESLDVDRRGINLSGNKTNPGLAHNQLQRITALDPPDYIMLISDGRPTEGENLQDLVSTHQQPYFTLAVGDSIRSDDIALDQVIYDEVVFSGRPCEIEAVISQVGNFTGKIRLRLYDGARLLTEKSIIPPGDGKRGEFKLSFMPPAPGRLILDMSALSGSDEKNMLNNRRKFSVRVLKSKMRILLYSSSLNQEYAFLNRFLLSRSEYEVVPVIDAPGGNRLGQRFPANQETLNNFDLIIFIDPDLNGIRSHYDRLASFLSDRGGGIFILMGEKYVNSAVGSRVAELNPLAISMPRGETLKHGQYHLSPSQRMIFHPALNLGDTREEIMSVWAGQPPFTVAVQVDSVRSSGVVLAFLEGDFDRRNMPAMALRRMGPGKILSAAVSPFWHWAFLPFGVGRDIEPFVRFFSGSIRWLTVGDESDRIGFEPVKEVFESGEEVTFTGSAYDEGFRPIENGSGDLVIFSQNGDSTVARILPDPARPGRYLAECGVLPPGVYDYRAELAAENVHLGRLEGKFAVDETDRETAYADVDWNYMARTAEISGGLFVSYRDLSPLEGAINTDLVRIEESHEIRLWDNIILLLIIVVSLSIEWFIRKSRQLL